MGSCLTSLVMFKFLFGVNVNVLEGRHNLYRILRNSPIAAWLLGWNKREVLGTRLDADFPLRPHDRLRIPKYWRKGFRRIWKENCCSKGARLGSVFGKISDQSRKFVALQDKAYFWRDWHRWTHTRFCLLRGHPLRVKLKPVLILTNCSWTEINSPFPSCCMPQLQSECWCKTIQMEMSCVLLCKSNSFPFQ